MFGASWKTSLTGIAALLLALSGLIATVLATVDGDPETVPDWDTTFAILAGALAGVGLLNARDDKVSTEQARKDP